MFEMDCRESATKRCRTRFNSWQIHRLEQVFLKTHYPDTQQMEGLTIETDIPIHKMQIWFQNRRAKWRKNSRLRNFGGLASVKETEYVPAPHISNTLKPIYDTHVDIYRHRHKEANWYENRAIDLRIRSLSDLSDLSKHLMPTMAEKSNDYKNSGGITSSNHMNAFEYPWAYRTSDMRPGMLNKEMPFPFASNQTMTSLLFAPHLYSTVSTVRMQTDSKCDSNVQNTDINK